MLSRIYHSDSWYINLLRIIINFIVSQIYCHDYCDTVYLSLHLRLYRSSRTDNENNKNFSAFDWREKEERFVHNFLADGRWFRNTNEFSTCSNRAIYFLFAAEAFQPILTMYEKSGEDRCWESFVRKFQKRGNFVYEMCLKYAPRLCLTVSVLSVSKEPLY